MKLLKDNPVRYQIVFRACDLERLRELRALTEAASDSEVIRHALMYLETFQRDAAKGRKLFVRNANGEILVNAVPSDAPDETVVATRNLVLPERTAERIDWLRKNAKVVTSSDVFRIALEFYHMLAKHAASGRTMIVKGAAGPEREYALITSHERPARPVKQVPGFVQQARDYHIA
jgi:hypothetical protein